MIPNMHSANDYTGSKPKTGKMRKLDVVNEDGTIESPHGWYDPVNRTWYLKGSNGKPFQGKVLNYSDPIEG